MDYARFIDIVIEEILKKETDNNAEIKTRMEIRNKLIFSSSLAKGHMAIFQVGRHVYIYEFNVANHGAIIGYKYTLRGSSITEEEIESYGKFISKVTEDILDTDKAAQDPYCTARDIQNNLIISSVLTSGYLAVFTINNYVYIYEYTDANGGSIVGKECELVENLK